jgi:hypothetical protein
MTPEHESHNAERGDYLRCRYGFGQSVDQGRVMLMHAYLQMMVVLCS